MDYTYTISGADLPQATNAAFYWSTDTSLAMGQHVLVNTPPIATATQASTTAYTGSINTSALGTPPTGADYKYLLFVVNPDSSVTESDGPNFSDPNSDNVKAVPIPLPDIAMQTAKDLSPTSVAVDYAINNVPRTPGNQFNVYQTAAAPTAGAAFVRFGYDTFVGSATLPASDTTDLSMGTHTGVTLPLSSPLQSDPTHLYVVVVANPPGDNHIPESDDPTDADNVAAVPSSTSALLSFRGLSSSTCPSQKFEATGTILIRVETFRGDLFRHCSVSTAPSRMIRTRSSPVASCPWMLVA